MNHVNNYLNFIPLDKSWITRMGSLDIINKSLVRDSRGREGFVTKTCAIREEKHIEWSK